ncbi:Peptidoglycan/LPS O-acetylase OafA/YrhL, contains acyltransferase and SGNH-hydrolase domains [Streptomyces sp. cf386]|uniref:acyltransferase family protein n=1 Tax=Streptomyces sp. cf386 TaxID=1761904 RepID=UPI00088472CA|nr:acyltransferase [Streptomyces sp. cf386]SDP01538.1 Peptidoglycan/LPS O-acetylase OafA/YrhL, contains acyltransferase and SGNH-hydrolase domains [Streptomyces sp. cf386]
MKPADPQAAARGQLTALDGLRGVAVLCVILYHTGQLRFGWLGVPLFFVLSGHFITRTLHGRRELTRGRRARDFFRNRALRLAPLYLGICAAVTVLAAAGYHRRDIVDDLPYLWTWTFDLRTLGPGWAPNSVPIYDQFWSLCVEVQLYALWAALALLLPRRWFVRVVVALAVTGPLLRGLLYLLLEAGGEQAFLRPFTLAQSPVTYVEAFAVGACTALPEFRDRLAWAARGAVVLCAAVTAALAVGQGLRADLGYPITYPELHGWLWQYTVVALFFGALVHWASRSGAFARLLSWRPLVRAGVISYGMYALHVAVLGQLSPHFTHAPSGWSGSDLGYAALVLLITLVTAELSYRFLETPFLRRKRGSLTQRLAVPDGAFEEAGPNQKRTHQKRTNRKQKDREEIGVPAHE